MSVCVLAAFLIMGTDINANGVDYVKGQPLTEKEIQIQKLKESQLFDNTIKELEFEPTLGKNKTVLPKVYDARDEGLKVPVKDQGIWGCCWAISALESAELSMVKQSEKTHLDFSEAHLAYFFYHRMDDLL